VRAATASSDAWIVRPALGSAPAPAAADGLSLICLSAAGGSPDGFRAWQPLLADGVGLLALRLPGRGVRLRESPYQDWDALIADAFDALAAELAKPHAFYGHSFGGRLAYELTHRAAAEFPGMTRRLFVGGCRSPNHPQRLPYLHRLSDPEFRGALRTMGGTPAEILGDDAVMRMMLPTIRAEIRLAELWDDRHGGGVDVPITAVCGRGDPIDGPAEMRGWPGFSQRAGELVELPGGHFFLDTHRGELISLINSRLGGRDG
jgi:surfactin synthase thioesterase subunit